MNLAVDLDIVACHALDPEALVEALADQPTIEPPYLWNCCCRLVDIVDHKAGDPVLDDLRDRAATNAITGVPQAIASIMTRPNGSGQSIGNSNAVASPSKALFSLSSISPMNSISGSLSNGSISFVIVAIDLVDLGGDDQRKTGPACNFDRARRAPFPGRCGQQKRDSRPLR